VRTPTTPKKANAKVGRCFRRLHAHGLIAKTPRTRRLRVTSYGRSVMGTSLNLREHHFPNVYANTTVV
jgi:ribosomal protein S19E (S16A)